MAHFGPYRWSAGEYGNDHTDAFRGAEFAVRDLTGATFVDCDMTGVKIVSGCLIDVDVSGYISNLVVNDVDVTDYVRTELDRRHPERVQLREMRTADEYRAMWATVERLWSATVERAERLPEAARHEQIKGEWSFAETLRHLIFITDAWASRTVLNESMPFHRLGLPQAAYPPNDAKALGIDIAAKPSFAEVLEVRADRMTRMRGIVDGLTDAELERSCTRAPAPGYPDEERTVGDCLEVVMNEECAHHRFATRDLAALEG